MTRTSSLARTALVAAGALFAACSTPLIESSNSLTVHGAGTAPIPSVALVRAQRSSSTPEILTGGASSVTIRMYALWISSHGDCSLPVLVQTYGETGQDKDFMQNPVLFAGQPAAGTYQCVMFRMSDVLRMKPATTFGACVSDTEYAGDIYRDGESDWKDVDLNVVVGHGTDDVPVDDDVTIFFSRDTAAALLRGISPNQLVLLESDLVVPAQSTFYMDAHDAVQTDGVYCGLEKPHTSFE
jgi:hypothetical protein